MTMNRPQLKALLDYWEVAKLEYSRPNSLIDIGEMYNFAWKFAECAKELLEEKK